MIELTCSVCNSLVLAPPAKLETLDVEKLVCTQCQQNTEPQGNLFKTGTLTFEQLADIVNDALAKTVLGAANCTVNLLWVVKEDGVECQYQIYRAADDLAPANEDPRNVGIAKRVLVQHADLVEKARAREYGVLNILTGQVARSIYEETGELSPEKAFELVVNLLGLSFESKEQA